jgi:hypothetical protein
MLYVSDPKALQHIFVKVCSIIDRMIEVSNLRCRTRTSLRKPAHTSRQIYVYILRIFLMWNAFSFTELLFGKGLLATLGQLLSFFSSRPVIYRYMEFRRQPTSEAAKNDHSIILNFAPPSYE